MYAINHAATALILKKHFPAVRMLWLLIAVQWIELLWVLFNAVGIEHFTVDNSVIHLGYLPWSHSILATVVYASVAWLLIDRMVGMRTLALAVALGILSHIVLDLLMHEPDIRLSPFSDFALGLNIQSVPLLTIIVETAYGIFCWWYFKGGRPLLTAIVLLNLVNIPFIFTLSPSTVDMIEQTHILLPAIILFQILYTWYAVWKFSNPRQAEAHDVS